MENTRPVRNVHAGPRLQRAVALGQGLHPGREVQTTRRRFARPSVPIFHEKLFPTLLFVIVVIEPPETNPLLQLAVAAAWDSAHRVVQQYEADPSAAWIHAVLHKIEGDLDNSRYWYRRAGKIECFNQEPMEELKAIKAAMTD
ncbi:MAG: hypothetical protein ACLQNE_22275 [Thermoguttaceae bacterium]